MQTHFIQHVPFESPGYLLQWAQEAQHSISFTKIFEAVQFPPAASIDLLVVMGGPMGVYEEATYPWLKAEKTFIREVIDAGKKVLGVCLGSQLVAEALGSKVYPNPQKEIGWWPVQVVDTATGSPTAGWPAEFTVFHWHGDTFDLPPGAMHLFRTNACPNQGYLVGNRVAGLQFHLEANQALVETMIAHGKQELVHAPLIQEEKALLSGDALYGETARQQLRIFLKDFLK